ncbi:MarR family transcriptional regulator [Psychrosphaera algicola]|uniref:MarR family transcriptional regulator n=1 Tax=Psychrosphaera algicola TaxID=3023714 RepID=A0ABT5F860_9GAMM|nr:MarR family transcriptional regulator [Psychrosphaera sp. G1-22]MDC2887723.1 MarR family transcriptional regulator [Psychrosphaera sp. G1-22]
MIAVLTGDIVNSTKMSKETYSEVIKQLTSLLQDVNVQFNAVGEIYRGDEFQIQYPNPLDALKSTLLIKLALHLATFSEKPIQCTLSLAYGEYDIYADKPNTSSGSVFVASGRGLQKTSRGELSLLLEQDLDESELNLLTQFLNHLLNRLTKTQATLLYQYIENDFTDHKTMAELTATTRQNISNRLSNIGAYLIKEYIENVNRKIEYLKEKSQ